MTLEAFAIQEEAAKAPTFGEYAEEWLATYAQLNCKPSTYRRYEGVVRNYLLPMFPPTLLSDLSRDNIKRLLIAKRETLTPSSVRQILAPLREMLNHAVDDRLLVSNPASRVNRVLAPRRQASREIHPFSREELTLFLKTVERQAAAYYPFFLCLARMGMRLGEALALQWGDLDWHCRFAEVRRSYTLGRITTPKNGKVRRVDLSRQLTDVLRNLLTQRKAETLRNGWGTLPAWVFCSQTGGLSIQTICGRAYSIAVWLRQVSAVFAYTISGIPMRPSCYNKGNL